MRETETTGGCWMQTIVQREEWSGTQGSLNSLVTWSGLVFELELVPPALHHLAVQYCCPINHQWCITLFYLFRLRSQQICRYHENAALPLCFQWIMMIADLPKVEPGSNSAQVLYLYHKNCSHWRYCVGSITTHVVVIIVIGCYWLKMLTQQYRHSFRFCNLYVVHCPLGCDIFPSTDCYFRVERNEPSAKLISGDIFIFCSCMRSFILEIFLRDSFYRRKKRASFHQLKDDIPI